MFMRIRRSRVLLVAVTVLVALGLNGCATTTGQGAGIGAAIGAAAGAVIGHQSGHALEGAAIGAGIGALAGAFAGKVIEGRVENQRSLEEVNTARRASGKEVPTQPAVEINNGDLVPTQVVRGNAAKIAVDYETFGTATAPATATGQFMTADGKPIGEPKTLTTSDGQPLTAAGTFVSDYPIPSSQKVGDYQLMVTMNNSGATDSVVIPFSVVDSAS